MARIAAGRVLLFPFMFLSLCCLLAGTGTLQAQGTPAHSGRLRVVSMNMGGESRVTTQDSELGRREAFELMGDLLTQLKLEDRRNILALQEVRNERGQLATLDSRMGDYSIQDHLTRRRRAFAAARNNFGNALVSSEPLQSVKRWYFDDGPAEQRCDKREEHNERRNAIASRLDRRAGVELWVVNMHLATQEHEARCQFEQVLAHVRRELSEDAIVLLVGDYNLRADGLAYTPEGDANCFPDTDEAREHRDAWSRARRSYLKAGFRRMGAPRPTFPAAPRRLRSGCVRGHWILDLVLLRDPQHLVSNLRVELVTPRAFTHGGAATYETYGHESYYTDHLVSVIDLEWGLPGLSPNFVPAAWAGVD